MSLLANNSDIMSPSMLRAIQRHRELFQDNVRELKRTKVCLELSILPHLLISL